MSGPQSPDIATPVIGVTVDAEETGGYSRYPWYALRQNYCGAVIKAGGLPIMLPNEPALAEAFLDRIDGLMVTGGNFDVDPALYGDDARHETVQLKEQRTAFELDITRGALARDLPVLGICGGEQLLAVALGGTLVQHVPDEFGDAIAHEQPNPRHEVGHEVEIVDGTLLHGIVGVGRMQVNSAHHQAVRDVPADAIINARSGDGVVEGIEAPRERFCLGVQWHPEFEVDSADIRIFAAFIDAAREKT